MALKKQQELKVDQHAKQPKLLQPQKQELISPNTSHQLSNKYYIQQKEELMGLYISCIY